MRRKRRTTSTTRWVGPAGLATIIAAAGFWLAVLPGGATAEPSPRAEAAQVQSTGPASRPHSGYVPGAPTPTAMPLPKLEAPVPPTLVPTPEPAAAAPAQAAAGGFVEVRGTDGTGVVLYREPTASGRMPAGFLEGARLEVLERKDDWARVRAANKQEGWVRAQYLAPAANQ